MQPTNPTPSQPMQQALGNQQQPQQPTPSIDPQLSKSIIDNLKDQSQQIEDAQSQIAQNNDAQSQQANQMLNQKRATISRALGQLNDKSIQGQIGKGIATGNFSYSGQCLRWVDDQQGNNSRQPTAYADFQQNLQNGNINTKGTPPKGARVYFAPTAAVPAGHIGISLGNGQFRSALDSGVKDLPIEDFAKYAGASYIGYSTSEK